jgi:hypothetical protein
MVPHGSVARGIQQTLFSQPGSWTLEYSVVHSFGPDAINLQGSGSGEDP